MVLKYIVKDWEVTYKLRDLKFEIEDLIWQPSSILNPKYDLGWGEEFAQVEKGFENRVISFD